MLHVLVNDFWKYEHYVLLHKLLPVIVPVLEVISVTSSAVCELIDVNLHYLNIFNLIFASFYVVQHSHVAPVHI